MTALSSRPLSLEQSLWPKQEDIALEIVDGIDLRSSTESEEEEQRLLEHCLRRRIDAVEDVTLVFWCGMLHARPQANLVPMILKLVSAVCLALINNSLWCRS